MFDVCINIPAEAGCLSVLESAFIEQNVYCTTNEFRSMVAHAACASVLLVLEILMHFDNYSCLANRPAGKTTIETS